MRQGCINRFHRQVAVCLLLALAVISTPALATVRDLVFGTALDHLEVPINQSRIIVFNDAIANVSVGNPKVADIVVLESNKLYVLGKSLGTTNVVVWGKDKNGIHQNSTLNVDVIHDIDSLKHQLHNLFPDERPMVRSAQGSIILSGEVSSAAKVQAITSLAKQFVRNAKKFNAVDGGGSKGSSNDNSNSTQPDIEVINLMQVGGPHQVMLDVKVAEVDRTVLKRMGVNLAAMSPGRPFKFGAVNGGASFPYGGPNLFPNDVAVSRLKDAMIGPGVQNFVPNTPQVSAAGLFASFLTGSSYFSFVVDAAKNDGLVKILAEPNLTALSGESAEFLSGGEFPIPVWKDKQQENRILFKKYGVQVKMMPVVLDSKRINLNLNVGVSEISQSANIMLTVPGANYVINVPSFTTRSASSTVELSDGQTIGIAGLISNKMREYVNKFPGLGDLPILGALFRSQEFTKDQTELVIFVTAHLVKSIDPNNMKLPTDAFSDPTDAQFFLFGRMANPPADKNTLAYDNIFLKKPDHHRNTLKYPGTFKGPTFGHQL